MLLLGSRQEFLLTRAPKGAGATEAAGQLPPLPK